MNTDIVWESCSHQGRTLLGKVAWVGLRACSVKISAEFFNQLLAREKKLSYVQIKKSDVHQSILFDFLTEQELQRLKLKDPFSTGIYKVAPDGGGKLRGALSRGAVIQCGTLIKHTPWIYAAATNSMASRRRFIPEKGNHNQQWIVRVVPTFLYETDATWGDVPSGLKGIYCYIGENNEILYIGQGEIKSRSQRHAVEKKIPATRFKWTPIADKALRLAAEDHHLNAFVQATGRLPKFNKQPARVKKSRT